MWDPCQESSVVYMCVSTATLLTWFTHIPPNTHIHYRYSPDMIHTYTTKHTYTQSLLSWHGSHIYHQTHNRYSPDMYLCVWWYMWDPCRESSVVYMCVWWYMCEPRQESSDCVYVCLVVYAQPLLSWHGSHIYHQAHIYQTATLLTWFTHIPPNTHIHNRYSPDMVHTYTTKHNRYSPDIICVLGGICVNHIRRAAVAYICVWWYMCEPCQESSGCVYVCLVVYIPPNTHIHHRYSPDMVHTYTTKHTYTQPLLPWHGSHKYHKAHIY
jgi:hypothetical protein